jgi:hypothetical protein
MEGKFRKSNINVTLDIISVVMKPYMIPLYKVPFQLLPNNTKQTTYYVLIIHT